MECEANTKKVHRIVVYCSKQFLAVDSLCDCHFWCLLTMRCRISFAVYLLLLFLPVGCVHSVRFMLCRVFSAVNFAFIICFFLLSSQSFTRYLLCCSVKCIMLLVAFASASRFLFFFALNLLSNRLHMRYSILQCAELVHPILYILPRTK